MQVDWKEDAEERFEEAIDYGEKKFGKIIAGKFYWDVMRQIDLLCDNPFLGKREPLLKGRSEEFRSLVIHPHYKLIYLVAHAKITIVDFWDVRREPSSLADHIR